MANPKTTNAAPVAPKPTAPVKVGSSAPAMPPLPPAAASMRISVGSPRASVSRHLAPSQFAEGQVIEANVTQVTQEKKGRGNSVVFTLANGKSVYLTVSMRRYLISLGYETYGQAIGQTYAFSVSAGNLQMVRTNPPVETPSA